MVICQNKQIKLLLLSKILVKKDLVDDFIIDIAGSRGIMIDEVILSVVDVDQMTSSIDTGSSNSLTRTGFTNPSMISTKLPILNQSLQQPPKVLLLLLLLPLPLVLLKLSPLPRLSQLLAVMIFVI